MLLTVRFADKLQSLNSQTG